MMLDGDETTDERRRDLIGQIGNAEIKFRPLACFDDVANCDFKFTLVRTDLENKFGK